MGQPAMTEGYEPRFDLDRAYGEEAETTVRRYLGLNHDQIEVKHKRREDWRFYVETAQLPNGTDEYKSSGINTTEASLWAYEINGTGIIVLFPTDLLKRAARTAPAKEERDGDNPTKGRLVGDEHLFGDG
jgi:hypothetical protein